MFFGTSSDEVFVHFPSASGSDIAPHPGTQLSPRDTVHELPGPYSSQEKSLIQLFLTHDLPFSEGTHVPSEQSTEQKTRLFLHPKFCLSLPLGLHFRLALGSAGELIHKSSPWGLCVKCFCLCGLYFTTLSPHHWWMKPTGRVVLVMQLP